MRRVLSYGPALVVLLAAGAVLIAAPAIIRRVGAAQTANSVLVAQRSLDAEDVLDRLNAAVRNIAASVTPSVVHLETTDPDSHFRWRGSTGAGWIYDDAGHVITNAHVVAGSSSVSVQLHDGQVVDGDVIGADPVADIAVIRIPDPAGLIPARRATGERLAVGDRVFAFGSPFGFKFSMSEGIVSGIGRSARTSLGFAGISNYIQTDAAVNPGNSGGPIVDIHGRVVGMNVAIATAQEARGDNGQDSGISGQSAGISFAIPLRTIEARADSLIKGDPVVGAFMGVEPDRESLFADGTGIRIRSVVPDGPADQGGLKPGDLVLDVDAQPVREWSVFRSVVSGHRPGEAVPIRVQRDDQTLELTVTLGSQPVANQAGQILQIVELQFGLELADSKRGPMVHRVIAASPADTAGLKPGQLILAVDAEATDAKTSGDLALLLRDRGLFRGRTLTLTVVVPDEDNAPHETVKLRARRLP